MAEVGEASACDQPYVPGTYDRDSHARNSLNESSGNSSAAPRLSDSTSSSPGLGEDKSLHAPRIVDTCKSHARAVKKIPRLGKIACVWRVSFWFFRAGKRGNLPRITGIIMLAANSHAKS